MKDSSRPVARRPTIVRIGRYVLPLLMLGLAVHIILPQIATVEHSLQVIKGLDSPCWCWVSSSV